MKSSGAKNLFFTAVLVVAVVFSNSLIGETGASGKMTGEKIATIDISRILSSSKKLKSAEDEIKEFLKNGEEDLALFEKEIMDLKNEMIGYAVESREYQNGKNAIEQKELVFEQKKRNLVRECDSRSSRALKQVYADLEQAVEAYSREHGIELVMTCSVGIDRLRSERPNDFLNWVSLVHVVWNDDHLDISDAVITIINGS